MKGLEGVPIKILMVCFLLLLVVSVGYTQITFFMKFKADKDFKEGMVSFAQKMRTLKRTGDTGGTFSTGPLTIPAGYSIEIDLRADKMTGNIPNDDPYVINLTDPKLKIDPFKFMDGNKEIFREDDPAKDKVTIGAGGKHDYDIRLMYDDDYPDGEIKELMLIFR